MITHTLLPSLNPAATTNGMGDGFQDASEQSEVIISHLMSLTGEAIISDP